MTTAKNEVSAWARKLEMDDLVWMGSDAKALFNVNRFWPSFVGSKIQVSIQILDIILF